MRERHEAVVRAAPDTALRAILDLPAASDGIVATLFALRRIRSDGGTIRELMARMGMRPLVTDRAYAGMFSPTKGITIGLAFWSQADERGARLVTETRVATQGVAPTIAFRLYWLVVGPFSALIRRRWLAAAKRRAEVSR